MNIAGEKELELTEVEQISRTIAGLANKEAKIIFGISQGKKYQNIVKTTLLATGCAQRNFFDNPVEPKPRRKLKKNKNRVIKTIKEVARKVISPAQEKPVVQPPAEKKIEVRKNAIQIKEEIEQEEAKMLEREKAWETPAFLRKVKPFTVHD